MMPMARVSRRRCSNDVRSSVGGAGALALAAAADVAGAGEAVVAEAGGFAELLGVGVALVAAAGFAPVFWPVFCFEDGDVAAWTTSGAGGGVADGGSWAAGGPGTGAGVGCSR